MVIADEGVAEKELNRCYYNTYYRPGILLLVLFAFLGWHL